MNILLDTHALWWFIKGDEKLPTSMQNVICDEANTIHVSAWQAYGKLRSK